MRLNLTLFALRIARCLLLFCPVGDAIKCICTHGGCGDCVKAYIMFVHQELHVIHGIIYHVFRRRLRVSIHPPSQPRCVPFPLRHAQCPRDHIDRRSAHEPLALTLSLSRFEWPLNVNLSVHSNCLTIPLLLELQTLHFQYDCRRFQNVARAWVGGHVPENERLRRRFDAPATNPIRSLRIVVHHRPLLPVPDHCYQTSNIYRRARLYMLEVNERVRNRPTARRSAVYVYKIIPVHS